MNWVSWLILIILIPVIGYLLRHQFKLRREQPELVTRRMLILRVISGICLILLSVSVMLSREFLHLRNPIGFIICWGIAIFLLLFLMMATLLDVHEARLNIRKQRKRLIQDTLKSDYEDHEQQED